MVEKHEGQDSPETKEEDTPTPEDGFYPEDPYSDDVGLSRDSTYCKDIAESPNSIYKEILYFLLQYCSNKGLYTREQRRTFLQTLCNIFRKKTVMNVLFELIEYKASTVRVLCKNLDSSQRSVYYALEFLESEGLVVQARPLRTKGRPTTVYALKDYTPDDIVEANNRDRISRTPGYTEAHRISQLILDDYFSKPEPRPPLYITDDIYPVLRRETRGFRWRDLERLVLTNLRRAQVTIHYGGKR